MSCICEKTGMCISCLINRCIAGLADEKERQEAVKYYYGTIGLEIYLDSKGVETEGRGE